VAILWSIVANFEELLSGILLILMSLTTISNVLARYLFNNPLAWAEEFSRYAFIWVVFLGAVVCTKQGRHIVIDGLVLTLPARPRAILQVLVDALTLGLMAVLVYYGWILTAFTTQPTSTLKVPLSVVYVVVPLSALLIALRSLGGFASHLRHAARGGER
jgi:TRAP-type C4-dicarboxylate transport system permease small subunit